jgi:hypothetical protein
MSPISSIHRASCAASLLRPPGESDLVPSKPSEDVVFQLPRAGDGERRFIARR